MTRRRCLRALALVAILLLGPVWPAVLASDAYDDRRVHVGARLFRAMLAADVGLEQKVAADGSLHILIYGENDDSIEAASELIGSGDGGGSLKGHALQLEGLSGVPETPGPVLGVFLANPPDDALLDELIAWGIREHAIVYSPFEGHVERGALGGVAIEAKVRPYINRQTMMAAGVELKPFFLKVSKVLE